MTFKASANEQKIIDAIADNFKGFTFFDDGLTVDSGTWGEVLNEEIADTCSVTPKSARGILASLVKKTFFHATREEKAYPLEGGGFRPGNWMELTELGVEVVLARQAELKEIEDEYGEDVQDKDELKEALAEITDEEIDEALFEAITSDEEDDAIAEETGDEADDESNDEEEPDEELPAPVPAVTHKAPTAHSDCNHATEGTEGKKARARCRAARAKLVKSE